MTTDPGVLKQLVYSQKTKDTFWNLWFEVSVLKNYWFHYFFLKKRYEHDTTVHYTQIVPVLVSTNSTHYSYRTSSRQEIPTREGPSIEMIPKNVAMVFCFLDNNNQEKSVEQQ